ncbi:uncharacterized membrane-anchored protein YitT (DUF2179 family) [Salirhabdus euzebyi]|uniref:Uncharacterized membrane-anchored protein YitT (DUF2179 family) n=1 Tax=Salirhabdus euzebyi TaxID=394506 RepID=A0A841Q5D5_9BACI|nr:YitT family protein [Salirhabdus euzebyi]MBB6453542.1 uncharacterized membrane-anchored protein YitT (DUF2179 family) [Salirhabdus euzebyi]
MNDLLQKVCFIFAGGAIQGFGMGVFLFPNDIPSGGAGGLAVLFHFLTAIDVGMALWIVNFSLLLVGMKYLGNKSAAGTLFAITITSISISFFEEAIHIPVRILWFDLLAGSIFLGLGIGILLRQGVSNGGIGVIALIISYKQHILPGKPLFWINCSIFMITSFVISWQIFIFALISQWISTRIVDIVCSLNVYYTYTLDWKRK